MHQIFSIALDPAHNIFIYIYNDFAFFFIFFFFALKRNLARDLMKPFEVTYVVTRLIKYRPRLFLRSPQKSEKLAEDSLCHAYS